MSSDCQMMKCRYLEKLFSCSLPSFTWFIFFFCWICMMHMFTLITVKATRHESDATLRQNAAASRFPRYASLSSRDTIAFGSGLASFLRVGHCKTSWKAHAILGSDLAEGGGNVSSSFSHRDIIFQRHSAVQLLQPICPIFVLFIVTLHNSHNP